MDLILVLPAFFNTYGPRMRLQDGRVVPNFIQQALRGEDLTVFGDGCQTRSFCYIDDMVEGIIKLLFSRENDPVNLGNPDEFSVMDLAHLVLEITGSRSKIVYQPLPVDDPKVRQPDISKARQVLEWSPKVSLREGVEKTIPYFKEKMSLI